MSSGWGLERGALWALDLPVAGAPPAGRLPVRYSEASPVHTPELASAMGVAAAEVAARFRRGCRAHLGWHDGELAAYGWISEGREHVGELARDLVLPEGESYVWDCATVPRFRGGGLYGGLLRAVADELAARGQRRCWIGASSTNVASNRAFATTGFRPVARVVCLRLGGRGLLLSVRFHPGAGADRAAAARSVLTGR